MKNKSFFVVVCLVVCSSVLPLPLEALQEQAPQTQSPNKTAEEVAPPPEQAKIFNVKTPYDDVTWMDVVKDQQKPIDGSNICLWFNYRDLAPNSRVSSIWYHRTAGGLERVGSGNVMFTSGRPWGRTYLPGLGSRNYPAGDYEVYFYVDGRLENRMNFAWQGPRQPAVMVGAGSYGSPTSQKGSF